jgi:hypothetical protein
MVRDTLQTLHDRARGVVVTPPQLRAQLRSFAFANANLSNEKVTREIVVRADEDFEKIFGS